MEAARFGTAPAIRNTVVVIPTYNERDNISGLIGILFCLYQEIHVLLVDDHSPDGTGERGEMPSRGWPEVAPS
jgi:dolichol-phosphate mannosyltransferase